MPLYSENIIFLDTEFTDLDIRKGKLLSIGLVKYTGEELYLELEHTGAVHPWVTKNVIPFLTGDTTPEEQAIEQLKMFIGDSAPYMMAYVNQFDAVYWYDLFKSAKEHPFYWIPLDFASILFAHGYDPNSMGKHAFFDMLDIDKSQYNQHNALDDAKLLQTVYNSFLSHISAKNEKA